MIVRPRQDTTTALGVGFVLMAIIAYGVHFFFPTRPFVDGFVPGLLSLGSYLIHVRQVPPEAPPAK